MATLRITATPPEADGPEAVGLALTSLDAGLREVLLAGQTVRRIVGLALPGAPVPTAAEDHPGRVFLVQIADDDDPGTILRALAGWHNRHPNATLAVKADGPGGGVSLRLASYSAVGFAGLSARIRAQLDEEAGNS